MSEEEYVYGNEGMKPWALLTNDERVAIDKCLLKQIYHDGWIKWEHTHYQKNSVYRGVNENGLDFIVHSILNKPQHEIASILDKKYPNHRVDVIFRRSIEVGITDKKTNKYKRCYIEY